MADSALPNITESLYRLLERAPFGGLKTGDLAQLSGKPIHIVYSLLSNMRNRGIIARDPQTRCWVIVVPNALFKGSSRPKPDPPPAPSPPEVMLPGKGVTAEDLEWMRRARATADARRQRQGVARG